MRSARCLVFLFMAAFAASLHGQGTAQGQRPAPPGTIRVRVRLIPVDVIVTDSHDRSVTDLKQEDFQIFENGRPQEIRHFSIQTFRAADSVPNEPRKPQGVAKLDLAPQEARTFMILLGRGRHGLKAVDYLIQFVRNGLLPQDLVALRAYNRSSEFTTDHEKVVQMLERYKKVSDEIESFLELYNGFVPRFRRSYQPQIDWIFEDGRVSQLSSGRNTEGTAPAPDRDTHNNCDLEEDASAPSSDPPFEQALRRVGTDQETPAGGRGQLSEPQRIIDPLEEMEAQFATLGLGATAFGPLLTASWFDINNIYNCIQHLSFMPGEKHLLYFTSNGIIVLYGDTRIEEEIAASANEARVAVDTFHTNGLVNFSQPPRASQPGQPPVVPPIWGYTVGAQSIRNISQLTGGRAAFAEDLGKALDRINEITRVEYLLGYYPSDENWDGKYRRIVVKVSRPHLKVSFRHGYNASDEVQPVDRDEFLATNRIIAAGASFRELTGIAFKARASLTMDAGGHSQLAVNLNIDPSTVGFRTIDTLHTGKLRIAIFYADAKQHYLGEEWKTLDVKVLDETYQRFLRDGVPCSIPIPRKARKQIIRVVIYDMNTEQVGSKLINSQVGR